MMKQSMLYSFCLLICLACNSNKATSQSHTKNEIKMETSIEKAIEDFVKGGDTQDVAQLETVLHPEFRTSVNQFKGADGVTVLNRDAYLGMIRDKKLGGTPRSFEVRYFKNYGHTASAELHMESSVLVFDNFLSLVQDKSGKWWVIADAATAKPK